MKKYIFDFICDLQGYRTSLQNLHWNSNSISQHELCDDISSLISEFQDKISEVEQSMSGNLKNNKLKGTDIKVSGLKDFVNKVIESTKKFYSKLKKEGDGYIGMRSDTEAFLSGMQRKLYLVNFTLKEDLKERLRNKINENRVTISNGKESYSLTENELREYVAKAIKNVNEGVYDYFNNSEFNFYSDKLKEIKNVTVHMVDYAGAKGDGRFVSFAGNLIRTIDEFLKYIEKKYSQGS